jgi:hypothetical protein
VLSDGVAGENCIVYHNGTANVFSNMERIYHSQTLQIQSVRRNPHTRSCIYREFLSIWRTKLFVSSDMKRVQDFSRTGFRYIVS